MQKRLEHFHRTRSRRGEGIRFATEAERNYCLDDHSVALELSKREAVTSRYIAGDRIVVDLRTYQRRVYRGTTWMTDQARKDLPRNLSDFGQQG